MSAIVGIYYTNGRPVQPLLPGADGRDFWLIMDLMELASGMTGRSAWAI